MKSRTTPDFRKLYKALAPDIRRRARQAYKVWRQNPAHPGLQFKKVQPNQPVYAVRIGLDYRALGLLRGDTIVWFWIGDHQAYDRILGRL